MTIDELRQAHDADLAKIDSDDARRVLDSRTAAATHLRLVLARVYGRSDMATARHWHIIPCLTQGGTVGILDIAHGTAWETGVTADDGVQDLGVIGGPVYAAANVASGGGEVRLDGEPVQVDGTAVARDTDPATGEIVYRATPPTTPEGWRQIALPTWRGYQGDGTHMVPPAMFAPETWIRPTLVARGLTTCYGRPGDTADGDHLERSAGWDSHWPHGLPEWIDGLSVTVLDVIADRGLSHPVGRGRPLSRTRLPRGTDSEELDRLAPILDAWRSYRWLSDLDRRVLGEADEAFDRRSPWEAAAALSWGNSAEILSGVWPDPVEPVGIREIAERLGVQRETVDQWRVRHVLPEPRWTVGGRPAWAWTDIEQWARDTGRSE